MGGCFVVIDAEFASFFDYIVCVWWLGVPLSSSVVCLPKKKKDWDGRPNFGERAKF